MTPAAPITPAWPIIIKHEGDDELSYVASLTDWQADDALCAYPYQDTDFLIDSQGYVFELDYDSSTKTVSLNPTHMAISLHRFSELVQLHLALLAQCCVSKVIFTHYKQGFDLIASSDDAR